MERCFLLEKQDRYAEGLAAARRALELRPWYRPGVQHAAHMLQLLDRDAEALDLQEEAAGRLQSGPVVMQLAMLQTELGRHADARQTWDRLAGLSPLAEDDFLRFIAARRSDAAYYCGDLDAALALAKESKNPFHEATAEKLEQARSAGGGRRHLLPVGFVRQHHMTCAPATLSALSRFRSMPVERLPLSEAVCYDGTPAHGERSWAGQNGYLAREFTLSWAAAVALLDRGVQSSGCSARRAGATPGC